MTCLGIDDLVRTVSFHKIGGEERRGEERRGEERRGEERRGEERRGKMISVLIELEEILGKESGYQMLHTKVR